MLFSSHDFPKIYLLGGLTGSGKTELLHHLFHAGQQVLNLEALCCHDGSAFARLQYSTQPTSYQFNKRLHKIWQTFNAGQPVFIEQELQRVGNLTIPEWLYQPMSSAPIIWLNTQQSVRIQRLAQLVRKSDPLLFCDCLQKLSDRIDEVIRTTILQHFSQGNIEKAVELLLDYYDNSNGYAMHGERIFLRLDIDQLDMRSCCNAFLLQLKEKTAACRC